MNSTWVPAYEEFQLLAFLFYVALTIIIEIIVIAFCFKKEPLEKIMWVTLGANLLSGLMGLVIFVVFRFLGL